MVNNVNFVRVNYTRLIRNCTRFHYEQNYDTCYILKKKKEKKINFFIWLLRMNYYLEISFLNIHSPIKWGRKVGISYRNCFSVAQYVDFLFIIIDTLLWYSRSAIACYISFLLFLSIQPRNANYFWFLENFEKLLLSFQRSTFFSKIHF